MYERVLDEASVAGQLVDSLRARTNAPLFECRDAAQEVVELIAQYCSDEVIGRISSALNYYQVDVHNCYDATVLRGLARRLEDWFKEKEELSYSISQEDSDYINALNMFSSITRKTDNRVPASLVEEDDYHFVNQLANLYQLDQSLPVRVSSLECLISLCETIPAVCVFVLESKLPPVLAQQIPHRGPLSQIDSLALKLLNMLFTTGQSPPLDHFDYFTMDFAQKLLKIVNEDESIVVPLIVNLHNVSHLNGMNDNIVVLALRDAEDTAIGHKLIDYANQRTNVPSLRLLEAIFLEGSSLVDALFYSNDISVLSHVLSRELINNEDEKVRLLCLKVLSFLIKMGICDGMVEDAVRSCTVDSSLREDIISSFD